MDLAEYKEKEVPVEVWNVFSFGVFVLICKEYKSFLMLKWVDFTKGIKLAVFNLVIKHVFCNWVPKYEFLQNSGCVVCNLFIMCQEPSFGFYLTFSVYYLVRQPLFPVSSGSLPNNSHPSLCFVFPSYFKLKTKMNFNSVD